MNVGRAVGGATFDNKLPPGTFESDTLGEGSKEADDDMLLRDSAKQFNYCYNYNCRPKEFVTSKQIICLQTVDSHTSFVGYCQPLCLLVDYLEGLPVRVLLQHLDQQTRLNANEKLKNSQRIL